MIADLPDNEPRRLETLHSYRILDTLPEQAFDDLTLVASQICGTPIALVSLIDNDRQWFKSRHGLDASETSRDIAFCSHALQQGDEVFIIPNALQDNRFADNPLVTGEPFIRFYAGAPLITPSGEALGTLCVIDRQSRNMDAKQQQALRALARQVMSQLELRRNLEEMAQGVAKQAQLQEIALEAKIRFDAFMDSTPIMAFIKDEEGRMIYVNKPLLRRFEKEPEEMLGKNDFELWPPEVAGPLREHDKLILKSDSPITVEEAVPTPDGRSDTWLSFKFPLRDAKGQRFLAGMSVDISDRKYYEHQLEDYQRRLEEAVSELERLSSTDALSGLKNKGAFTQRLDEETSRAKRYNLSLSLLCIDVDNFKEYNDQFGHPAGDDVLKQLAKLLQESGRPSDVVARIGGEEFAVILTNTPAQGAFIVAERLRRCIESAVWTKRRVTVSIGMAEMSEANNDSVSLVESADKALYVAKRNGRNQVAQAH